MQPCHCHVQKFAATTTRSVNEFDNCYSIQIVSKGFLLQYMEVHFSSMIVPFHGSNVGATACHLTDFFNSDHQSCNLQGAMCLLSPNTAVQTQQDFAQHAIGGPFHSPGHRRYAW
jgi:hypothetical protein